MTGEEGPDHDKSFYVEVLIGDRAYGDGKGRTKKSRRTAGGIPGDLEAAKKETK